MKVLLPFLYLGAVVSSGIFMFLHNGQLDEAFFLSLAVASGLGFTFVLLDRILTRLGGLTLSR
ncbi:MAG: hypothetical protein HY457_01730 [Parcubacteria group bacterium]|nr:hypothetical protein [Parcubacteria group bacterium]